MTWGYLAGLCVGLMGLALLDWRYRLAFFAERVRSALTLTIGVVVLMGWDAAGVALGIFFRGDSPYLTGLLVAPEIPVEELFFLTLLCYQTLVLWCAFTRGHRRRRRGASSEGGAA